MCVCIVSCEPKPDLNGSSTAVIQRRGNHLHRGWGGNKKNLIFVLQGIIRK